jgi:hypothetical protein
MGLTLVYADYKALQGTHSGFRTAGIEIIIALWLLSLEETGMGYV